MRDVVLELRPLLTKDKLLVSIAAGTKLKDLQVYLFSHIFRNCCYACFIWEFICSWLSLNFFGCLIFVF